MAYPDTNPTYQYIDSLSGDGTALGRGSAPILLGVASNSVVRLGISATATTKLGDTSASLVGFWGATESARVAFTNATVATTAATSSASMSLTSAQYAGIIALVNEVRTAMVSMGLKA